MALRAVAVGVHGTEAAKLAGATAQQETMQAVEHASARQRNGRHAPNRFEPIRSTLNFFMKASASVANPHDTGVPGTSLGKFADERILASPARAPTPSPMNPLQAVSVLCARLTWPLQSHLASLIYPPGTQAQDFLQPSGEAGLVPADSVSCRIFANPIAMLVGGVAAVLLELAEPRVRTGVWEHTTFREQPMARLKRTAYAAMLTAFGPRSRTETMIGHINRGHARIAGSTPAGTPYRASDVELLTWVHATSAYGFAQGYALCVRPLTDAQRDRFYRENQESARLYGVAAAPATHAAVLELFEHMRPGLEPSAIVLEFLDIINRLPMLPAIGRPLQRLCVRAAVQCLPEWTRERLGLAGPAWAVAGWQWALLRSLGRAADHLSHPALPAMLARQRLASARAGLAP
jgi:uncharacterized protein (DUF2236 family)